MRLGIIAAIALVGLTAGAAFADAVGDAKAGQDALNRGDDVAAIALFSRAIDAHGLSAEGQESAYVERATAYVGIKEFDLALADIDLAQSLAPNDPDARNLRAQIPQTATLDQSAAARRGAKLYGRGDYDGAETAFNRAIELNPNDGYSYYERGLNSIAKSDYNHAVVDLTIVLRLKPDTWGAYDVRGDAYRLRGDYDRAIADYSQAIQMHPNDAAGYFGRGQAYAGKRDATSALTDLDHALQLQPNVEAYLYGRCTVRSAANVQLDRAMADCNRALELFPNDANVLDARAFVWYRRGTYGKAIDDTNAALQIDPRHASSLFVRGLAEEHSGQAGVAAADIRAAQAINPKVGDYYAKWGIRP